MGGQFCTYAVPAFKGARQQGITNQVHIWIMRTKRSYTILPTRNARPQVVTLILCGAGHFNKDVPHNVLLILQYLNLVTNQEKEFSESRIRVKWQRRDAKLQSRDSANQPVFLARHRMNLSK
jgi:hypothetical protein